MRPYFIRPDWDGEANVWVATSDDVPGFYGNTPGPRLKSLLQLIREIVMRLADHIEVNPEIMLG